MKKTLLLTFAILATIAGQAATKSFTDSLVVSVNGNSAPAQLATATLDTNEDGTYNLSLKNFIMGSGQDLMPVGNINIINVVGTTDANDKLTLKTSQTIKIAAGDEGYTIKVNGQDYTVQQSDWMGPMLGDVPVNLTAYVKGDKVYCLIDINMASLGQTINVKLGSEYQTTKYTDNIVVSVNGTSTAPQQAVVNFEQSLVNDSYNLSLKNFILGSGQDLMPVGNIDLTNVIVTKDENALMHISTTQTIKISAGDPGYSIKVNGADYTLQTSDWMGPMLPDVPVVLSGIATADKMAVNIDINMVTLGQVIGVKFGTMNLDAVADYNFGKVGIGQTTNTSVKVSGFIEGKVKVIVTSDANKSGATAVFTANADSVAAGNEVQLSFLPQVKGEQTATVTFMVANVDTVSFKISGTAVQPIIAASESSLTFEPVEKGYSRTKTITVTGTDLAEDITATITGSTDFTVSATTLKEGATELNVEYSPTSTSTNTAKLTLSSKYADDVVIALSGSMVTGIDTIAAENGNVNVYNLNGVLVRKNVAAGKALNGLAKGVYLINGKKIVK
jgi:hypothetical protein